MSNMSEWAGKSPQNSIFLESPLPGILLPGDPGGVKRYEWHFWTPAAFCDLGQQFDLYTETILVPRRCWTFKNYDSLLRSLPPSLICTICGWNMRLYESIYCFFDVGFPIAIPNITDYPWVNNLLKFQLPSSNSVGVGALHKLKTAWEQNWLQRFW